MFNITVTTSRGLDDLLLAELSTLFPDLAFKNRPGQVYFSGSLENIYQICIWSRLANRVLVELATGKIDSAEDLYDVVQQVDWQQHFAVTNTFIVDFVGTNRVINNTQFGALKIKDAIVDQFSRELGDRPSVSKISPDIRIQGRVRRETFSVFIDVSGQSLHQRHYRQGTGQAPLKEHIACAMLMRSGWTKHMDKALFDPMCGSGTIAIEAALMASNIAPRLQRVQWGFNHWLGHDDAQWDALICSAQDAKQPSDTRIYACDSDHRVLGAAKQNAHAAGIAEMIEFHHSDATKFQVNDDAGFIVSNPPYGERLNELSELLPVFQRWGVHLKTHFKGWNMGLLTTNRDLLKQLKFAAKKDYKLNNGPLECLFVVYSLDERNCEIKQTTFQDSDFSNRVTKNVKSLGRWLKSENTNCYRIYDADLPEYNVAIDRYGEWLVVQEYAPPKSVPEQKAKKRLHDVVIALPHVLDVSPSNIVLKTRQQQKGTKQYEKVSEKQVTIEVYENGAKFIVNLTDYLDTGLFLDHRITRQLIQQKSINKDVLNLFAYTGSVSVHAGLGGAKSVTTVDMSKTYLDWAKKNVNLNALTGAHHFVQADCVQWLKQHTQTYDLIFIDPPSFSNSKRMDSTWDVQRDHVTLIEDALRILAPDGEIVFSNNLRSFKLDSNAMESLDIIATNLSSKTLPEDYKRNPKIHQCWSFKRC